MSEKVTYGVWGAVAGAVALAVVGFTYGEWKTASGAKQAADAAVQNAMLPFCADAVLAIPAAVEALKAKQPRDYDDIVRDHLKNWPTAAHPLDFTGRRDCGKAIEAKLLLLKASAK